MQDNLDLILRPNPHLWGASLWYSSAVQKKASIANGYKGYWAPYSCRFVWLDARQLQGCIARQKVASVTVSGASIADFFRQYVIVREKQIKYYEGTGAATVRVCTFGMMNIVWSLSVDDMRRAIETQARLVVATHKFFLTPQFVSSEREPNIMLDRLLVYAQIARQLLLPLGWRELNWMEPTAGFTFETATLFDGMHIIGPPMKLLWNMLWTYLCGSTLEAS